MRHHRLMKRAGPTILSAAVLAVTLGAATTAAAQNATGASGWVNPLENRYLSGKPLEICDQGSFFVGGVPKVTNFAAGPTPTAPQQLTIGQMYVQFQIPKKRRQWPLIIMHGSGYTGSCLEATPDGREGWLPHAVRNNLATFIVDQPGRGRSGFDRSVIHEGESLIATDPAAARAMIPSFGGASDGATWTSWYGHIINGTDIVNGTMIPHGPVSSGDPNVHPETTPPSEAHGDYPPAFPIPPIPNAIDPFIAARVPALGGTLPYGPFTQIGAIGPAPNPANNDYLALEAYKYSVPNTESTLPGSVCPACVPTTLSGQVTWGPRAMAEMVETLGGAIISGHSQGTAPMLHTVRILKEDGLAGKCGAPLPPPAPERNPCLAMLKGIIIPEGAAFTPAGLLNAGITPTDMANIPFLMVNGDYRPAATRIGNRAAGDLLNSVPRSVGPAAVIDLENVGPQFNGTTHMNMLGTTQLLFFDFILDWASKNIKNPMVNGGGECGEKGDTGEKEEHK